MPVAGHYKYNLEETSGMRFVEAKPTVVMIASFELLFVSFCRTNPDWAWTRWVVATCSSYPYR